MVLNLADPGNFVMVVKDFGSEEVDFTGEQHAHNQGAHPVLVPTFSPASQLDDPLFLAVDSTCPLNLAELL